MSNAVEIIVKAMQDKSFRETFFRDKERVLKEYRLNDEEAKALKGLDQRTFDKAVAEMGQEVQRRISLGGFDSGSIRMKTLDYPVIENFDGG